MREKYHDDPAAARQRTADWRKANPEKRKVIDQKQAFRKMGVTSEWYEEMARSQEYVCAICGNVERNDRRMRLSIDHDHRCCPQNTSCEKCRRGLLCHQCNLMIGSAMDDPAVLEAAAEYLRRWSRE